MDNSKVSSIPSENASQVENQSGCELRSASGRAANKSFTRSQLLVIAQSVIASSAVEGEYFCDHSVERFIAEVSRDIDRSEP